MTSEFRLIFAAALLGCGLSACAEDNLPQARELARAANIASDLSQIETYKLTAVVATNPGSTNSETGRITIYRDKGRFRSDVEIKDYRETRIILGGRLHLWRSTPEPRTGLVTLGNLDRAWRIDLPGGPKRTISKTSMAKVGGMQAYCFEVKQLNPSKHRTCVDATTKLALVTSNDAFQEEFFDYATIEQVRFPQKIRLSADGKVALEIRDIRLEKTQLPPETFTFPNEDPKIFRLNVLACDSAITGGEVMLGKQPEYPPEARARHDTGTVFLYVVADGSGTVKYVGIETAPTLALAQASMEAVKQWKYSPAMCGTNPVFVEREVKVKFYIR